MELLTNLPTNLLTNLPTNLLTTNLQVRGGGDLPRDGGAAAAPHRHGGQQGGQGQGVTTDQRYATTHSAVFSRDGYLVYLLLTLFSPDAEKAVFQISRDYPGILIVLI